MYGTEHTSESPYAWDPTGKAKKPWPRQNRYGSISLIESRLYLYLCTWVAWIIHTTIRSVQNTQQVGSTLSYWMQWSKEHGPREVRETGGAAGEKQGGGEIKSGLHFRPRRNALGEAGSWWRHLAVNVDGPRRRGMGQGRRTIIIIIANLISRRAREHGRDGAEIRSFVRLYNRPERYFLLKGKLRTLIKLS